MRADAGPVTRALAAYSGLWWAPRDLRPFALLRVGCALAGLAQVAWLWPVRQHFLGAGGLPTAPLGDLDGTRSALALLEAGLGADGLLLWSALAFVALGLGALTPLAAIGAFLAHLLLSRELFAVAGFGSALLQCYLFFLILSPCGRVWSVDAAWRKPPPAATAAWPQTLIRLQVVVLYLAAASLKLASADWRDGAAVYYFLQSYHSRLPGMFWAEHAWLPALLTYATLAFELAAGPLLCWRRTRWWAAAAGCLFHATIAVTASLYVYSLCVVVGYLAFVDGADVDRLAAARRRFFPGRSPSAPAR